MTRTVSLSHGRGPALTHSPNLQSALFSCSYILTPLKRTRKCLTVGNDQTPCRGTAGGLCAGRMEARRLLLRGGQHSHFPQMPPLAPKVMKQSETASAPTSEQFTQPLSSPSESAAYGLNYKHVRIKTPPKLPQGTRVQE